jgi:SSS family transporter
MSLLDWSVFALYFGAVLAFAYSQSRKNVGIEGYFLANRRLPWGAIGLSVMATQASAITFIGTTGQAFENGMEFIQVYLPQPLVMVLLCVLFVPFFYRAKVYTAYEYLENRFDAKTRSLTSLLFLISRGMAAGIVLYAPAVVLSVIMSWDETVTILIMGTVTVLYTMMGGITAVIWTDVLQMLMMFAGIAVALVVLFGALPPEVALGDVVYIGGIQQMWTSIDLSWDPTNTYTLWSGLIGGFFLALAYFGCDQSQVQRYLTARSLKQSRLALIFNAFVKVPMQFAILAIGVLLFVFYHFERPPLIFNPAETAQVKASSHAQEFARLEVEHQATHDLRKEATLSLLEARRNGEDLQNWRRQISQYDQQLSALRSDSKQLVLEVRGVSSNDVNYVFPSYLVKYVPAGVLGLMIAVIFAAAMSSLDSELTALSSATIVDFYRRYFRREASSQHYLRASRVATLFWGVLASGFALYAGQLGSLIEAVNRVGSYFYGSLLGVFLLAFLVKRANGNGAFAGLLAGMLAVFLVSETTDLSFLYYNVVGAVVVVAVGTLWSLSRSQSPDSGL